MINVAADTLLRWNKFLLKFVKNHFYSILIICLFIFLFFTYTTPGQRVNTISEIICAMVLGGDGPELIDKICRD